MTSFWKRFCTAFVAVAATSALSGGLAGATPQSAVPSGGFISLGIYAPLCEDLTVYESGYAAGYVVASGISVLDNPAELQLQMLVNGDVWTPVGDYDGVEAFVNDQPVDGHDALWAHVTVNKNDRFEIRHHRPADGSAVTYRLLVWPTGNTQPTVWRDARAIMVPSLAQCEEFFAGVTHL